MINPKRVHEILTDCICPGDELTKSVTVQSVMLNLELGPTKLEEHKAEVAAMLQELPAPFHKNSGGGWTFLNACVDKDGNQWGEHEDVDALFALAIAMKLGKWTLSRNLWKALPGGMPYFTIL